MAIKSTNGLCLKLKNHACLNNISIRPYNRITIDYMYCYYRGETFHEALLHIGEVRSFAT